MEHYEDIKKFFIENEDKWFYAGFISRRFDIKQTKLRTIINDLRQSRMDIKDGIGNIASGKKGYCYTKDKDKLLSFYLSGSQRIKKQQLAVNGVWESINEGQPESKEYKF